MMEKAHLLSEPGKEIRIAWKIEKPTVDGKCRIAIADAGSYHFEPIIPLKHENQTEFPCGNEKGVEAVDVVLPQLF
jgi:hypothetical protein